MQPKMPVVFIKNLPQWLYDAELLPLIFLNYEDRGIACGERELVENIYLGKECGTVFCPQVGDFRIQNIEKCSFMKHRRAAVCKEGKNPTDQNAILFLLMH